MSVYKHFKRTFDVQLKSNTIDIFLKKNDNGKIYKFIALEKYHFKPSKLI